MNEEKVYEVWCGEYSDRCMVAIFHSKEKAEKYVEVQDKLNGYNDHYVIEDTFADDRFDINTEVSKMYYCTIYIDDLYNYDKTSLLNRKGDIETDEMWDDLMENFLIESYEDVKPENYNKYGETADEVEERYGVTIENMIYPDEVYIDKSDEPWHSKYITVYSKRSYAHARKIAIEQYQIETQQKLENGEL